jgi:hypothetical protein
MLVASSLVSFFFISYSLFSYFFLIYHPERREKNVEFGSKIFNNFVVYKKYNKKREYKVSFCLKNEKLNCLIFSKDLFI